MLLLSELATVLEGWGIHMVFSRAHPVCGCVDGAARPISLYLLRLCPDRIIVLFSYPLRMFFFFGARLYSYLPSLFLLRLFNFINKSLIYSLTLFSALHSLHGQAALRHAQRYYHTEQ